MMVDSWMIGVDDRPALVLIWSIDRVSGEMRDVLLQEEVHQCQIRFEDRSKSDIGRDWCCSALELWENPREISCR